MKPSQTNFTLPSECHNASGHMRTVGFELEFSGIALRHAVKVVCDCLNGSAPNEIVAEVNVKTDLGDFNVEVDWDFLKRTAAHAELGDSSTEWLKHLSEAAALLVPIEVVCPPIAIDQIQPLDALVNDLRSAGAMGTQESLIAAYGVHINTELPALDAKTISRYLRAFVLLQWWLVEAHHVDIARRASPYINLFDESYVNLVLSRDYTHTDDLIDDYLQHNPTRNRALDMLPLFAHIDEARVRSQIDDPKIKARPTFHYRLPNCSIDDPQWSLAKSWGLWCEVERLANDESSLDLLANEFRELSRPVLGVSRTTWVERIAQWINDHA